MREKLTIDEAERDTTVIAPTDGDVMEKQKMSAEHGTNTHSLKRERNAAASLTTNAGKSPRVHVKGRDRRGTLARPLHSQCALNQR